MSDSASESNRKKVPILTGTQNYDTWSRKMKAFLITQKAWKAVDPAVAVPTSITALTKWRERDEVAYGELFLVVSDEIQGLLDDLDDSGRAIWTFLASKYAPKNTSSSRQTLRTTFYNLTHDPTLPVDTFITNVKSTATKLKAIGHPLDPDEISDKILMSLDTIFMPIRTVLTNEASSRDLDGICDAVIQWEEAEMKRKESPLATYVALSATYHRGGKGRQYDWGNTKGRSDACSRCGLLGHKSQFCIHDMPEDVKRRTLSRNHHQSANIAQDVDAITDNFANVAIDATESGTASDREALYALAAEYGEPIRFVQHAYYPSSSPNRSFESKKEYSMSALDIDLDDITASPSHNLSLAPRADLEGGSEATNSYWDSVADDDSDTDSIKSEDFSD